MHRDGIVKVALVAHRYPPALGGVERHVAELAFGMVERGIEVEAIVTDPTGRLPRVTVEGGVTVRRFPTVGGDDVFYVAPSLGAWLLRHARRFDLIHAHSYHTPLAFQALVAARASRRPFVLTPHFHGTGHSPFRRALHVPYRLVGGLVVRGSRPLICVSEAERALLAQAFGEHQPVVVAPNGVDVASILQARPFPRGDGGRLLLAAGRLEAYKHVDDVVRAASLLGPEDALAILGTGPAAPGLRRLVDELGIGDRVQLLGHVPTPELQRWLRTADVLVTLSRHEAFGISLLEAAVAGAAVVASDIPAHRETARYLPPDRVAFVPVDASPAAVAAAIRRGGRRELDGGELGRVPTWRDTVDRTLLAYSLARGRRRAEAVPAGRT